MVIIVGLVLFSLLFTTQVHIKSINTNYASKENTLVIKGFFVLCVFLSHIRTYVTFQNFGDSLVIRGLDLLGQLMVTLFLFYSGYGVFESIKNKGEKYIRDFPIHRILMLFCDFSFAIILFVILGLFVGRNMTLREILLAFTGWTSVGNSNWYMFAIFTLYIITYLCFKLLKDKHFFSICLVSIFSLLYVYIMSDLQPSRFSNTYLCYVGGMWYSYFKSSLDLFLKKYNFLQYICMFALILSFVLFYPYKGIRLMFYNFESLLFCLLVVFISMRFTFKSQFLSWLGKYLFWIYILQRIPMILLEFYGITSSTIFLIITIVLTIVLSIVAQKISRFLKFFVLSNSRDLNT